jgi:hypothetical protein
LQNDSFKPKNEGLFNKLCQLVKFKVSETTLTNHPLGCPGSVGLIRASVGLIEPFIDTIKSVNGTARFSGTDSMRAATAPGKLYIIFF